jgi:hypothetical protein
MSENPNEGRDSGGADETARDVLADEAGRANPDTDELGDQALPEGDRSNRRVE